MIMALKEERQGGKGGGVLIFVFVCFALLYARMGWLRLVLVRILGLGFEAGWLVVYLDGCGFEEGGRLDA